MPKARIFQTNFTTGEISPLVEGLIDLNKYYNACQTLENFLILPQGGVQRRPGTRFVNEVKDSTKKARLVPFTFSVVQAYILEFGDLYIRFYKDGARIENPPGTPVEVATPYTEADLPQLKFAQSADVLYIVHPNFWPRKLSRFSHTSWKLDLVNFNPPPSYEADTDLNTTLTPGATTGNLVTFTAGAAVFLDADIDRHIQANNGGQAIIRDFTGAPEAAPGPYSKCRADIVSAFPDINPIPAGQWFLRFSPMATCTPDRTGPVGTYGTFTLDKGGWRSDVGKFLQINGGTVRISNVDSRTQVRGRILTQLSSTASAGPGTWTLEVEAWSQQRGYPRAITFFEQRLFLAGSSQSPQTLWGSQSGDYENFAVGIRDNDALQYTIASGEVNAILWLVSARSLLIGTVGGEFRATGGADAPLTPTNVDIKSETSYGSADIQAIRIGNVALFVQRSRCRIHEMVFSFDVDSYVAPDLTLLSEHITGCGITEIAYQESPSRTVWVVRSDGVLLGMTYLRDQRVVGWHRHITDGQVESIAVIPAALTDQVWLVVKRTINGVTKRYVEYLDPALHVDSGLTYSGAPATTFSGLSHLEGKTVKIVGDGAVYPDVVVSGGQVTITPAASNVQIGLGYTSKLVTVRPEISPSGVIQGRQKRWNEIWVRLYQTIGLTINGEQLPFRRIGAGGDLMDGGVTPFTGDRRITNLGYDREGRIVVEQRQPLSCTILSVFGSLNVGD